MQTLKLFWEKIFHRKEVRLLRRHARYLDSILKILKDKDYMILNHLEKLMIIQALKAKEFRAEVELPATQAGIRKIYRELKEKFENEIKKGR
jgi:hypothetical protein